MLMLNVYLGRILIALYDHNAVCIAKVKGSYIKGDRIKHISPKLFFMHELQKNGDIDVHQNSTQ